MRNIMGCWFLHTDRSKLPALIFDPGWYNVAIHVRPEGVLSLYSGPVPCLPSIMYPFPFIFKQIYLLVASWRRGVVWRRPRPEILL